MSKNRNPKMKNVTISAPSQDINGYNFGDSNIEFAKFVHDIKGPLNSMKGLLRVAKMDVNSEVARHYLELLEQCQEQLDSRIHKSLNKLNNADSDLEEINFEEMIEDIKASLQNIDGFANTEFNVLVKNKCIFYADYETVYSIFLNIIENAIKYRKNDSSINTINIVLLDCEHGVHVKIADNGKGIKEELIPTVFNMNVRDGENADREGHGLGLAIIKQLITRMNGNISMDTKHGIGTTFNIELPNCIPQDNL